MDWGATETTRKYDLCLLCLVIALWKQELNKPVSAVHVNQTNSCSNLLQLGKGFDPGDSRKGTVVNLTFNSALAHNSMYGLTLRNAGIQRQSIPRVCWVGKHHIVYVA